MRGKDTGILNSAVQSRLKDLNGEFKGVGAFDMADRLTRSRSPSRTPRHTTEGV